MLATTRGLAVLLAFFPTALAAQTVAAPYTGGATSGMGNASYMWGTNGGSILGPAGDSASIHVQNGTAAAQVNAARRGYLLPDNITIQAIGSQNIVSVTINGSNNVSSVTANQTASNSGNVTNSGIINEQK